MLNRRFRWSPSSVLRNIHSFKLRRNSPKQRCLTVLTNIMAILNELGIHQVSARTLGLGTLGAILLFSIVHVVYHRFFNPCARFPGPAIASISKLWKVLSLLSGEGEKTLMELHKKYGKLRYETV